MTQLYNAKSFENKTNIFKKKSLLKLLLKKRVLSRKCSSPLLQGAHKLFEQNQCAIKFTYTVKRDGRSDYWIEKQNNLYYQHLFDLVVLFYLKTSLFIQVLAICL